LSYNGSGTFVVNSAGQPVVTGTVISSTAFNALTTDLATGLSTAITKDGQTTPTANIKLGGFKLTNVGAATTSGDALTFGSGTNSSSLAVPTRQKLTSGTAATYTTPANCRQLRIRMVGGGGGGGSFNYGNGGSGGDSIFNSITAAGGAFGYGALNTAVGNGGNGQVGTGTASLRVQAENGVAAYSITIGAPNSKGGNSGGGLGFGSVAGSPNGYGAGGYGATYSGSGGGGAGGEYVELIINTPAATYTYTVGAAGTAGSGSINGGAGSIGIIIVDEIY
jgi:hypothetical protein